MSYWNYRILAKEIDNDISFSIHEVHYDDNGIPVGFTENPTDVLTYSSYGDPVESIKWILDAMRLASEKPILDYDKFPSVYQKYYRKIKINKIDELYREETSK